MNCFRIRFASFGLLAVIAGIAFASSAQAQLIVTPTITPIGSQFHYNYSVTNNTPNDIFDVDVSVRPGAGVLTNLVAPTGFQIAYDSGLGLVSFLEDTSTFSSSPTTGVMFDSYLPPRTTPFAGNYLDSNFNIQTTTGFTQGANVPEPGLLTLVSGFAVAGALIIRRRKVNL